MSPAGTYGAWVPGERSGSYRVGGEVALFDADGASNISGADFALRSSTRSTGRSTTVPTSASPTDVAH